MPTRIRRLPLFAFTFLLLISVRFHHVYASLDKLRRYQRKCWRDIGRCIMFMDGDRAYGCAQCGQDTRTAILREFKSVSALVSYLNPDIDTRVLLLPEYVFFNPGVLQNLETATNVAAVIVYESTKDANNETLDFPPIFGNELSTDLLEPNMLYNYYPPDPNPSPAASPSPSFDRNSVGKGSKFLFFPFNIFHVNATIAQFLRERIARFPTVDSLIAVQDDAPKTSAAAPRYKAQSRGQMYACPTDVAQASDPSVGDGSDESSETSPTLEDKANSGDCLKEKKCLPIGGQSLWSALERVDFDREDRPKGVLAITAPMDSLAFFPDLALGASAEMASVAVLMTVAKIVSDFRRSPEGRELEMVLQPVYFLWNAESWGYTGSARFLKDVTNFTCADSNKSDVKEFKSGCVDPFMNSLKFQDFNKTDFTVLNIGQITSPVFEETSDSDSEMPSFFKQSLKENEEQEVGELERALDTAFDASRLTLSDGLRNVTPIDSSQSFRRYFPNAEVITVTSYENVFNNTLYHSIYDNETLIKDRKPIYLLARSIAKAVISLAFDEKDAKLVNEKEIDESIDQLLTCMTSRKQWLDCNKAEEFLGNDTFPNIREDVEPGNYPGSFFPSTRTDANPAASAKFLFLRSFLAYYNRYEEGNACTLNDEESCSDFMKNINMAADPQSHSELRTGFCTKGKCVASDTYSHDAFGPGINSMGKARSEFNYINTDEAHSNSSVSTEPREAAWTESVWDFELGFCGFVEDTSVFGGVILGLGIFVMVLSILTVYCFDLRLRKSDSDPGAVSIAPTSAGWPTEQNA